MNEDMPSQKTVEFGVTQSTEEMVNF